MTEFKTKSTGGTSNEGEFKITFSTDSRELYMMVQETCRKAVDTAKQESPIGLRPGEVRMCELCEGKKSIELDFFGLGIDGYVSVEGDHLAIEIRERSAYDDDDASSSDAMAINYCPKCGRKLGD